MRRGLCLVEVLLALALLGAGILPAWSLLSGAGRDLAGTRVRATLRLRAHEGLAEGRARLLTGHLVPGSEAEPARLAYPRAGVQVTLTAARVPGRPGLVRLVARVEDAAHVYEARAVAPDPGAG